MIADLQPLFGKIPLAGVNLEVAEPLCRKPREENHVLVWPESGLIRWSNGAMENWRTGELENWRTGELENWRTGELENRAIWISGNLAQCGDYHARASWFPKRQKGRFFNISLFWWQNFYHWMCDVLPRLHGIHWDFDLRIILPPVVSAWCPQPATCFEIFEPSSLRICYWSLAKALGHRHFCAVAESRLNGAGEADMHVDPDAFEDALNYMVQNSQ